MIPWRREWQPTAWRIPWTKEPGRLPTMGCRVRCNWATITFTDYPYIFINSYLDLDLSQPLKADPASSPHLQFVSIRGLQTRIFICLFVACVSVRPGAENNFCIFKGLFKKNHTRTHPQTYTRLCNRGLTWYIKSEIFTTWFFAEKLAHPGFQGLLGLSCMAWFMAVLSLHPYSHPVK